MFLGSRSSKGIPSGSAIVTICNSEDRNRKIRDFAKTSPMQLLLPNPNAANLYKKSFHNSVDNLLDISSLQSNKKTN